MASQAVVQTGILAGLGAKLVQAHNSVKGKPVEAGNMGLPEGIEGGVAKLTSLSFGVFKEGKNKGKPYFMGQGVVFLPETHNGVKIAGRQTKLGPMPLCDTPEAAGARKTFADHYKHMRDVLHGLGFDIDQLTGTPQQIEAGIIKGCKALCGDPKDPSTWTYFLFRTWKGKKQTVGPYANQEPRVNEEWGVRCDAPGDGGTPAPGAGLTETAPLDSANNPEGFSELVNDSLTGGGESGGGDDEDLDALAAQADPPASDNDAQLKLDKIAADLGLEEQATNAASYADVVVLIREAQESGGTDAGGDDSPPAAEEFTAEKGVVYKLEVPKDPKNPKKGTKKVDVETVNVDNENRTCTLKDCSTKKVIMEGKKAKSFGWDALIVE